MNTAIPIPIELIDRLRASRHVVVLTGSGTSAESGVPTFRDKQDGLWSQYRPEDLATHEAFDRDPALVWNWYEWRREIVAGVEPNPGHFAIAEMQRLLPRLTLITQNVDGLHQRAGSTDVIEFHGNIMRSICSLERHEVKPAADDTATPPACPDCGAPLRPDVVWFGEAIPEAARNGAFDASGDCDTIIVVGTSAQVQPAASLAIQASMHGAAIVEINVDETPLTSQADFVIRGKSGETLPALVDALRSALHG